MTRNPYDDNAEVLRAAELNALANAFDLELVLSGCAPSKGTGDFDVDVASGTIIVAGAEASVGSQTVTLTSPANDADYDSGEERVDLVTINSSGTASATEGTPAANPNSPDIPADEVLVARVHTLHSDTSLTASDIFDARLLFGFGGYPLDNADLFATQNFAAADQLSAYPLTHASDLDTPAESHHVRPWSTTDDLSDVTFYSASGTGLSVTLLSVTDGPNTWLGGFCWGRLDSGVDVTVDGGTTQTLSGVEGVVEDGSTNLRGVWLPAIGYDSSLTITLESGSNVQKAGMGATL